MKRPNILFDKHGGYRKLHSFTYATIIHLETIKFCKKFIPWQDDPLGKDSGQMIGAARSGRQNIIEGSERSATSKETEIKLTDVARGSLAELLGDYEVFLADRDSIPWSRNSTECQKLASILLPEFKSTDNHLHEYWKYYHSEVKPLFAQWFGQEDCIIIANALTILIQKTMAMLANQIRSQGEAFLENGGFRERMYQSRSNVKSEEIPKDDIPFCPECDSPMRIRNAQKGKNLGSKFWGCSKFPACKGTRNCDSVTQGRNDAE